MKGYLRAEIKLLDWYIGWKMDTRCVLSFIHKRDRLEEDLGTWNNFIKQLPYHEGVL